MNDMLHCADSGSAEANRVGGWKLSVDWLTVLLLLLQEKSVVL